jgi:hypothetical protein
LPHCPDLALLKFSARSDIWPQDRYDARAKATLTGGQTQRSAGCVTELADADSTEARCRLCGARLVSPSAAPSRTVATPARLRADR